MNADDECRRECRPQHDRADQDEDPTLAEPHVFDYDADELAERQSIDGGNLDDAEQFLSCCDCWQLLAGALLKKAKGRTV